MRSTLAQELKHIVLIMGFLSTLFGCNKEGAPEPPESVAVVVSNDAEHNAIYERGSKAISPHMQLLNRDPKLTERVRREVEGGIRDLDAVTTYNPTNWAAFWIKGKGYQLLGNHRAANSEFKASFDIQQENPDVAREYAASCLELGLGGEAVRATEQAIKVAPGDAGLRANLALALMIDGRNTEAKSAIDEALRMSPDDKISRAVQKVVDDVLAGRRKQPKTMADLNKS
jgi:Flp pilus assembly protein TadD